MSTQTVTPEGGKAQLRDRILRAGSWMLLGHMARQVLRLGSNLVLTRLLVPEMFGVMAIVTVVLIGLEMISDVGLRNNIIQSSRGEERIFLNTAWAVSIIRSSFLYIIALLLSYLLYLAGSNGWISEQVVYANPVLPSVIAVMSLTVLISGFNSTKLYVANRKIHLGRIVTLELVCQLASVPVMIGIAFLNPTIWALVIGALVNRILFMILSHTAMPGQSNRLEWEAEAFYEIFHFGKWVFLSSLLGFFVNQGDRLLLGGLISAEILGVYSIALLLVSAILQVFQKIFSNVLFPALSEVSRERKDGLSRVYYKIRFRVDLVTMFTAGMLFATGQLIVEILYDDRYLEAGWMMQILSLSIAGIGFTLAKQIALALGHTRFFSGLVTLQLVTLYSLTIVLFKLFGLPGAIWGIVLYPVTGIIASFWYMKKNNLLQLHREVMMIPLAFVGWVVGVLLEHIIRTYLMN